MPDRHEAVIGIRGEVLLPDAHPRGQNEKGIPREVTGAVSPGGGKPVKVFVGYTERHESSIILAGEASGDKPAMLVGVVVWSPSDESKAAG